MAGSYTANNIGETCSNVQADSQDSNVCNLDQGRERVSLNISKRLQPKIDERRSYNYAVSDANSSPPHTPHNVGTLNPRANARQLIVRTRTRSHGQNKYEGLCIDVLFECSSGSGRSPKGTVSAAASRQERRRTHRPTGYRGTMGWQGALQAFFLFLAEGRHRLQRGLTTTRKAGPLPPGGRRIYARTPLGRRTV